MTPAAERIRIIRELLHARLHADFDQIRYHLDLLEEETGGCTCRHGRHRSAHITVTTSQEGTTMGTYSINTDVDLTAVVKNDQGQNITDTITWTTAAGTVTTGADSTDADGGVTMTAVLSGITTPGDVAVTATTSDGLPYTDTITFTDPNASVPASITVTDSAAPATAPASA